MAGHHNGNPFDVFASPVKGDITPPNSPQRKPPSKAAMRYSPEKSMNASTATNMNFLSSSIGRNFVQRADQSPLRDATARKLFSERESPIKAAPVLLNPFNDVDSDSDNESVDFQHFSVHNSPRRGNDFSRSVNSNRTELETPKPVFSASTFAIANDQVSQLDSQNQTLGDIPMLTPGNSMRVPVAPLQQPHQHQQPTYHMRSHSIETNSTAAVTIHTTANSKKSSRLSSGFSTDIASMHDADSGFDYDFKNSAFDKQVLNLVPRRNNFIKHTVFKSQTGHLVLDTPISQVLRQQLPEENQSEEFNYVKYSAVTADPDDFLTDGYTLRPNELQRETELVVCVTMYNEDEVALTRTLHAIFKNIKYLAKRERSATWGKESWKKIVVCIISDGRNKVSPGVLEVLTAMGVYQEGIAKSYVNKKEVQAHMFEYTAQVTVDEDLKLEGSTPVQIIFCLKEKNQKKINSHRWLFNAICPILNPNVCVLLDVGTRPNESAIYNLWKAFDLDSNVAGAAGEIVTMKGKYWKKLLNPLVATQNFEYKMSNILDKPCESVFGYISVLPGALSAYRYSALKNHPDGTGPLKAYFQGEKQDEATNANIFSANMYLAEDRILAWELCAKRDASWVLKYCKDAKGETDVPETMSEFVLQRRRWLNGAFFAALYSLKQFYQIWGTSHSFVRKLFFHLEFFYQAMTLVFSFFSIANFYITFYYLAGSLITIAGDGGKVFFEIMNYICICTLLSMLVISMGNKPTGAPVLFYICILLLTICGLYSIISGFYFLSLMIKSHDLGYVGGLNFASICISLASTYGLYAIMSVLYLDPWHIITSSIQYFLFLPSLTCLLQIYAFCNTHDVSWGTKGDTEMVQSLGTATVETDDKGVQYIRTGVLEQQDIDSMYCENVLKLKERRKTPEHMRDEEKSGMTKKAQISQEDYYRDVRSRVVLFWVIANVVLVMTITQIWEVTSINTNKYLAFILWSVFGFSVFRFCGSFSFLLHLILRRSIVWFHKWQLRNTEEDIPHMSQAPKY